jgi:hypothetical protein
MYINSRAFIRDSRGGLKLEDLKGSGVPWSLAKTHRLDLNITGKPRGLFVKCHTFFLLRFWTEDRGGAGGSGGRRRRRPRPLGARRLREKEEETKWIKIVCSPAEERSGSGRNLAGSGARGARWRLNAVAVLRWPVRDGKELPGCVSTSRNSWCRRLAPGDSGRDESGRRPVRASAALLGGQLGSAVAHCTCGEAGLGFAGKEAATFIGAGPEAPLARTPRRGGGGAVYCHGHAASRMGFGRVCGWAGAGWVGPTSSSQSGRIGFSFFLIFWNTFFSTKELERNSS